MTAAYKIAGKVIEITSLYGDVHEYCREYRCDEAPDFSVVTAQADIDNERETDKRSAEAEARAAYVAADGYLEQLAVYRRIAEKMVDYDTFLFHGSCVAVDGEGYLFTASSGTGKSTHTRLWRELLGERAVMVNDDKPLIKVGADGAVIYGTPYNGKHRLGSNIGVPLKAVCLLERAKENSICEVTASDAYPMLVQQMYRPREPMQLAKSMGLLDRLIKSVKLYRLGCNMDISAAKTAYEGMK